MICSENKTSADESKKIKLKVIRIKFSEVIIREVCCGTVQVAWGFRGTQLSILIRNTVADEKKMGGREGVLCIELACCK